MDIMNKQNPVKNLGLVLLTAFLAGCAGHNASMVAVEDLREQQQPQSVRAQTPVYSKPPGSASNPKQQNTVAYATPAPGYEQSGQRSSDSDSSSSSANTRDPAAVIPQPEPIPALLALLEKAEEQQRQGQAQQALVSLERAQRIAPREPIVYLQLSQVYRSLDDKAAATQMARKGLSLSSGNADMQQAFNDLLTLIK